MVRVLCHTPAWLSRPSPGFQSFQPEDNDKASAALNNGLGKKLEPRGRYRTIAQRGTEVFFVVEKCEIRWSDFILLRDATASREALEQRPGANGAGNMTKEDVETCSKILKVPVAGRIRQLVISPLGDYLAIITSHTVHIAILPTRFDAPTREIRLRTFQLGPTAHVLEQAPIASALWHPFGHLGSCLVTVTTDACVRLWELNRDSRSSFDEPAMALDLKKLANATSSHDDLRASKYGTSKGFSPDSVEMEVAAACFGGIGTPDEHGWSPMTLWVAMTEGDVYALCPLLPSKWQPSTTTIPCLSTSVVSKAAAAEEDASVSAEGRRMIHQQQKWLSDIDSQEPVEAPVPGTYKTAEVFNRPSSPPAIPRLQGPFQLTPDSELGEVTDIFAIAPCLDDGALGEDEEDEFDEPAYRPALSAGVICLADTGGKVHICLDLMGVEAQWLPSKKGTFQRPAEVHGQISDLLRFETVNLSPAENNSTPLWPTFTPNIGNRYDATNWLYSETPAGRYAVYVTSSTGMFSLSLLPWISSLEEELNGPVDTGAAFRLKVLYDSVKTEVDHVIKFDTSASVANGRQDFAVPAGISLIDSDLGHFVLTSLNNQPYAAILDTPTDASIYDSFAPDGQMAGLPAPEVRQSYQPPAAFYAKSSLPAFLDSVSQSAASRLKRADLKSQVRFSPATLQLLTEAHRLLSDETNRLGVSAADLFRRCERMRAELFEQVRRVDDIANRVEAVTGEDEEDGDVVVGKQRIDDRMKRARASNQGLQQRVDTLRKKMAGLGGKELSRREEAWAAEVNALGASLGLDDNADGVGKSADGATGSGVLGSRFDAVTRLQQDLVTQAKEATDGTRGEEEEEKSLRESSRVPPDFRKQKLQQVMQLLERETALVDAVMERLGKLGGLTT